MTAVKYNEANTMIFRRNKNEGMNATMEDIARDAGVSISTVSRVINGYKGISEELRSRVEESICKYNYKPNAAARSLITKRTDLIAVIQPNLENPILAKVLKEIAKCCSDSGRTMIVCDYDSDNDKAIQALDSMREHNVDGVIFFGVYFTDELIERLKQFTCPVILVNQEIPDREGEELLFTTIGCDNYKRMSDATEFLIKDNHRRIAYIGGQKRDYSNGQLRLRGFLDAMEKNGLPVPESYIAQTDFSVEGGREGMRQIYEKASVLPTAVLCGSDMIAVGCIRYLQGMKLRVPEDISVFGHDDSLQDIFEIKLSTVSSEDNGKIICERLFAEQENSMKKEKIYYPYQLIRRQSTRRISDEM